MKFGRMNKNNLDQIEEKEREKIAAGYKKKRMPVSGKSVFGLKKIIEKKASPPGNNNQDTITKKQTK